MPPHIDGKVMQVIAPVNNRDVAELVIQAGNNFRPGGTIKLILQGNATLDLYQVVMNRKWSKKGGHMANILTGFVGRSVRIEFY